MPMVFAGMGSHGPGTTGRAERADPAIRDAFFTEYRKLGDDIRASGADALVVVASDHFGTLFMDKMPGFTVGMADFYEGPIEDEAWLKIKRTRIPGNAALSKRLIARLQQSVDVAFAEEYKFDHGVMVPLNFLTPDYDMDIIPIIINCQAPPLPPLHRCWALGEAIRAACDDLPEKFAVVGTGGISHWPCTPDSGKINEEWDYEFMRRWAANDREAMLSYTDAEILTEAGQGGFEIRTYCTVAAAAGGKGTNRFLKPIPIFATMAVVAEMEVV